MQKNIRLNFLHNKLSRFIFFCFLLCSLSLFLFAENSFVLSPVEGNWSNYQSIIIDVPEGATAFYSFTGDNPLYSGFAYESPVLLELEGDINLKVAILNKDNSLIEENINFSVNKGSLNLPFVAEYQNQAIVTLSENNISIPSNMRFSIGDEKKYFLKGKTLTVDSKNSLEQILPLQIQDENNFYRFMIKIPANFSSEENLLNYQTVEESDFSEDDYTIRRIEKKLSECPFVVEFIDWSKIKISTGENIYVCLDDDVWQTGTFDFETSRDISHTLSWIDLTGVNFEEFIPEQFKVYFTTIPAMPTLNLVQDKSKVIEVSLSDKNFQFEIVQNQKGVTSKFSEFRNKKYFIDTVYGNDLNSNIETKVYYDGIYQGKLFADFSIDKMPPKSPSIILSDNNFFVRNPVEIKFTSDEKIFYVLKSKVISSTELKNLELELTKNFAFDSTTAIELKNDSLVLFEDNQNAIFYNLAYFSKDDFGNVSEVSYYQVLIDSYNYYIEANLNNSNYVQDGSAAHPFSSFEQILPLLKDDKFLKIHVEGNFVNVPNLTFSSPCEIISSNGARFTFLQNSFISVENTEVKISNCVFEQNFINNELFAQQNLFKLDNAILTLDNCETVSLYNKNGSVIFANNSKINILNSGLTVQSKVYSSVFNLLNSDLNCEKSRISAVADSVIALTMNSGTLMLNNCQIQVNGKTSKIYELFGVEYSIQKNQFYCNDNLKKIESVDVFSKKISYENNEINSF